MSPDPYASRWPRWAGGSEQLPGFLLALAIGAAGGALFSVLRLPLAWMLGAMTFCTVAAIARVPIRGMNQLRPVVIATIAVALGAEFSPEVLHLLAGWLPMLAALAAYVMLCALASVIYFQRVGGYDLPTALFAGMPGGIAEMITMGVQLGADERRIALSHASRVFLIVMSVPYLLHLLTGAELSGMIPVRPGLAEGGFQGLLWFVGCAVAGVVIGRRLRLPAAEFFGPLVLTAALQVAGVTAFQAPQELIVAAQLVLGTLIGCGFAGADPLLTLKIMSLSLGATVLVVAITVGFALGLGALAGIDAASVILSFSPGGITEMGLLALSLDVEVAVVALHHLMRLILVLFTARLLLRLLKWRRDRVPPAPR